MKAISSTTPKGSGAQITACLYEQILSGQFEPGERLAEVALAEQFQVSRGPIRDALRHLASIGLVTFTPNVGASVRSITHAEAKALYEYRLALECEAARWAALRIDEAGKQRLQSLLGDHAMAMTSQSAYAAQQGDNDFHEVVAQLSQSPIILKALTQELYPQLVLLRRQHKNVMGRGQGALIEHQRIAEAIQHSDADLAALLMRRHLQGSWLILESQL